MGPPLSVGDSGVPDAAGQPPDLSADRAVDAPVDRPVDPALRDAPRELPPKGGPGNGVRTVPGRIELVGSGQSSCSHESAPGATASGRDRWCAFTMPFGLGGNHQLMVINITKATVSVNCTSGTDPNCLRLTQNLWLERNPGPNDPRHPFVHRFTGDTLTFNADAVSGPGEHFRGRVYAWRPGWPAARQISSDDGWDCVGHFRAPVATCVDGLDGTTVPATFDLRAGSLSETAPLPLPKVDRIVPSSATGLSRWRQRWDRDGRYLAWSTGRTDADSETYYWWRLADGPVDQHRMTGPAGISRWSISYDGRRTYLMKAYSDDLMGSRSGELWIADFPDAGAGQVKIADRVGGYALPYDGTDTDRGIAFMTDVVSSRGDLRYLADPAGGPAVLVEPSVTGGAIHFGPVTHASFSKGDLSARDLAIKRLDTGTVCQVATASSFGGVWSMLQGGRLLIWAAVDASIGLGEGRYTTLPDCTGGVFANGLDSVRAVGNQGWFFTDGSDGRTANLKYVHSVDGAIWPVPMSIQSSIGTTFGVLEPELRTVVYTIDLGYSDIDGLYVDRQSVDFSPVPAP